MVLDENELTYDSNGDAILNPKIREHMKSLEKSNAEFEKRLREADLRGIYAEVGVPADGLGKLFRDTYQGEVTVEAVRSAATSYGLIQASQPSAAELESERQRQEQLNALGRINATTDSTGARDATDILTEVLAKLKAASDANDEDLFDSIMESPEVQALRNQPIAFM